MTPPDDPEPGRSPLDMPPEAFRALGHRLVDRIADFLAAVPTAPAGPELSRDKLAADLPAESLPETGRDPGEMLERAGDLLMRYSRLNGHPRSWGYVIGSPAPLGMLGDFLAAAVNPNCAAWYSSPAAAEIERQTVAWIADLLGYPIDCGGLLTSGGNMANIIGFLAARRAKAGWDLREEGLMGPGRPRLRVYATQEVHTWLQKAVEISGLGLGAICLVATDTELRLDPADLARCIEDDRAAGAKPFLVVASAGTVSTGAVDPLPEIAALCRAQDLWFHVDGAYGGFAAAAPGTPADLAGLREADSLAVDGHKWLCVPLEAGCVLVRDAQALRATFHYQPSYYHYGAPDDEAMIHYQQYGPQNSRGFRALKLWLALQQAGRQGYVRLIADNIRLSQAMARAIAESPELEPATQGLSIATFRYRPAGLDAGKPEVAAYLNELNKALVERLQASGELYLSNAVVGGRFLLRACITNFRTRLADVQALPEIVRRHGAALDREMRPKSLL